MTGYMTPTNSGSTGYGLSWKLVRVTQRFPERLTALVVDQFGKGMEIRYDIMGAKGLRPELGESWIVEHKFGRWIFSAIVAGGGDGVGIPAVDGLTDALGDVDTTLSGHDAALAALDARLDLNETSYKHLWGNSTTLTLAENTALTITSNIATARSAGIATATGGQFMFNRAGRWALNVYVSGVAAVVGGAQATLQFGTPSPATTDGGSLVGVAYAYTTFVGIPLSWVGWVGTSSAAQPFTLTIGWSAATAGSLTTAWRVGMEYLGPF